MSKPVMPLIAMADTSLKAWTKLNRLFTNRSRTRVMQIKESLMLNQRGTWTISEFLLSIKATVDELALIDTPLSNDDITLHVLNTLGAEYRDIIAPIRARESSLSFEELHDLLTGHKAYLNRLEALPAPLVATTNFSSRRNNSKSKQ